MRDVTVIGQDKTLLAAKREHAALPRMTVIRRDICGDQVDHNDARERYSRMIALRGHEGTGTSAAGWSNCPW